MNENGTDTAISGAMVSAVNSSQPGEDGGRYDIAGLRVLVVDDDDDTRELLYCILSDAGATVACASSVRKAFELLATARPEVIISDIEMPEENGYSFIRNLRSVSDEDGAKIPAIALSGRGLPQDKERSLSSGFNLHLTKPIAAADLLVALQTVTTSHQRWLVTSGRR